MFRNLLKISLVLFIGIVIGVPGLLGQSIKDRIACPAKISQSTTEGSCGAEVDYTAPFSYLDEGELVNIQNNYEPNSYFDIGESTIYYKAVDLKNNSYFCIFKVRILDKENPYFDVFPEEVRLSASTSEGAYATWDDPVGVDNCGEVSVISDFHSGDFFPVGHTVVTYWVYDTAGNYQSRSFDITITDDELELSATR